MRYRRPQAEGQVSPVFRRDRLAALFALVTVLCVGSAFILSKGVRFLMPGPLTSAHGAIENCSACHAGSGTGKLSWVHRLVPGDPLADSKACLTCHKMPEAAFNPHTTTANVLNNSTERMTKIAARLSAPLSARVQSTAFPTHDMVARGLACATCHQEHQGANFKLNKIANEQCRSCHVVKFDSFDGLHPDFGDYPFKKRTRIIYDHAGHFAKHYPELAKKDPAKRIPADCSTCHNSRDDKRIMAVAPFDQTCSTCHLDQITGKARVSGPKGIAFMTLPGLDLETLKKKKAPVGEWPDGSESALTPFMKVMIGRDEHGRGLIKAAEALNLQDLTNASDDQIKAVTDLAWEIKRLFHALISGKASDVLGGLNIVSGAKLSAGLVTDLTASLPRDVVVSAQQQWLPNLAKEIATGPIVSSEEPAPTDHRQSGSNSTGTASTSAEPTSPQEPAGPDASEAKPTPSAQAENGEAVSKSTQRDPPACLMRVLGQCLMFKESDDQSDPARLGGPAAAADAVNVKSRGGKATIAAGQQSRARPRNNDAWQAAEAEGSGEKANGAAKSNGPGQADDLLFPTENELQAIKAHDKNAGGATRPDVAAPAAAGASANSDTPADKSQAKTAPVLSIESDIDPESWAEYGGWYRQDYAIYYRPTGHKDKFVYSWLFLTGPKAPRGDAGPAAAVFDVLTSKEAQGSCTKCHSVDDIPGKGRVLNFSPASLATKQGSFTSFVHEPHFGLLQERGCLSCHKLENDRPYLKSYERGNPQSFASNFGAVKKDICQTCHNSSKARADCLTCHKYHVNGVVTPIMKTKLPIQ